MKPGLKRDLVVSAACILFLLWGLFSLQDWEKARARQFLKTGSFDHLPFSENIEHRRPEGCVKLFEVCLSHAGNVGE